MNSPYNNIQLQQIQQQLHQHFMGGLAANNNAMMMGMMLPALPMHLPQEISEPIIVEESEDEDDEEQRTLFVANLDERVTEELLYEIFLQAGPIERAKIPKDNVGRQRTFGFITYTKRCSAPYAMHLLKGLALYRKSLTIKYKGKNMAPPLKSQSVLGVGGDNGNNRQSYDNSSLRSGNFSSYKDSNRMMDNASPSCSSRQERISKHASNQMRPHSNSGPYQQRRDSPSSYDKWNNNNNHNNHNNRNNNHNNNNNKNGNNRYSDHRSGKYRR